MRSVSRGILITVFLLWTLSCLGLIPGLYMNGVGINYTTLGWIESVAKTPIFEYPRHFGQPLGAPIPFGLPFIYLGSAFYKILPISSLNAYCLSGVAFISMSYIGCLIILKRMGAQFFIAAPLSAGFLTSSMIIGHRLYGPLMESFALFPTYCLVDLYLADYIKKSHASIEMGRTIWLVSIYIAAKSFSLFMDGYAFVMWGTVSAFIFLFIVAEILRQKRYRVAFFLSALFLLSHVAPYLLYSAYIPQFADAFQSQSADFFRAMGADVFTMFVPDERASLLTYLTPLGHVYQSEHFYGDGSNIRLNYLGIVFILACCSVFLNFQKWKTFPHAAMLLAAVSALIISFGPSLKFNNHRLVSSETREVLLQDYLMPKSAATFNLGTDRLYKKVPGLRNMRAVYRWLLVVKFFAVVGAAILLSSIFVQPSSVVRWMAIVILILAFVDVAAPLPRLHAEHRLFRKMITDFDRDVVAPLQQHAGPRDKVVFLSTENDYLANYIAGKLNLYTYNIGSDKNIVMSQAFWPEAFQNIRQGVDVVANVRRLFLADNVKWLIIPYFSLRWDSYAWPPIRERVIEKSARVADFDKEADFIVIKEAFFSLVGLRH